MRPWMFTSSIARIVGQSRRGIGTGKRAIIAHLDPQPCGIGLDLAMTRTVVLSPCNRSAARTRASMGR